MLSKTFPKGHLHAGEQTFFKEKLGISKLHTIRANYSLWQQRIAEIQAGKGVLSIRQWSGKPYRSKQVEIVMLTAENGIGIQRLDIFDFMRPAKVDSSQLVDLTDLANNDGLSFSDWYHWFRLADVTKPMAIIHFTNFRY